MKATLYFTLTLLTFVTLAFAPNSFAQQVRLIYFIPKDRTANTEINSSFDSMIKDVKQFYEDVMDHHGYGQKTFSFETDSDGNAVVTQVTGKLNEEDYESWPTKAWEEIDELYGTSSGINVVALDISEDFGGVGTGSSVHGKALFNAFALTDSDTSLVVHELAHAFGLKHDGRDINDVDWAPASQDSTDSIGASLCAAGWLDAHRFFNSSQTTSNYNSSVQMLTPALVDPPLGIRLRFTATDSDGIQQVQLVKSSGETLLLGYKQLDTTSTTVEFTTDRLLGTTQIGLRVMDQQGNFTTHTFSIDITTILPPSDSVSISDTNLASAIRSALSLDSNATITELHMQGLTGLNASNRQITDLTGLEHATGMQFLILRGNQISNLTPLADMTELLGLYLEDNQVSDLSPIAALTKLGQLWLRNNQISDISHLSGLTKLFSLGLENNQISDLSHLSGLTEIEELWLRDNQITNLTGIERMTKLDWLNLENNQISNISPLSGLTNLELLFLAWNQISDLSPLTGLTSLEQLSLRNNQISNIGPLAGLTNLEQLSLNNNQISDVSAVVALTNLESLGLFGNPITDQTPLETLKSKNPDIQIYIGGASVVTNNPPVFSEGGSTIRLVSDGTETDEFIGSPITANDTDSTDTLTYTHSGTDASSFDIDSSTGQLKTKETLSYDTKSTYTVIVSVSDGRGGTASITVTINVTRADDQSLQADDETTETEGTSTIVTDRLTDSHQIGFSELMFYSRGGLHSIAQWVELYNNSDTKTVNLRGWQLTIEARDSNGKHRHAVITLEDLHIPTNQTVLIVTWQAPRKSTELIENRIYNFFQHHSDEFEQNQNRNKVLGLAGFYLKLTDADGNVSDVIGNLDGKSATEDEPTWALPPLKTADGKRVSLVRWYNPKKDVPLDGTIADNWVLASKLELSIRRYWGNATDIGNPGHRLSTAPLPVTLSHFRAEHTDAGVILKWTTESEVDNAGFYIYRSQTKAGEFKVVNPQMIQGAGTTGERQNYTWTDTTAKPNTVYYYRIEDVSHAGERQQLANVRLRGLVSARGKLTTQWADLKGQE